jgi:MoaA/NifB/PqqE/SkfB family radical SAM enzyme
MGRRSEVQAALTDKARLAGFFGALAVKERLKPDLHVRPLVAELFLTENCNLRCVSCACWRTTTKDELTTAEWMDVLDQLAAERIYKVNFTGGEPLVRRDAVELMRHATGSGIRHLHLNTNAILLTPQRITEVLDAGVRSFNVSIDGTRETHDLIRGRAGSFDTSIEHLRALTAAGSGLGLKIRMNFTVMRGNVTVLPDVARLAQELGVRLYLNLATDHTFLFQHEQVTEQAQVRDAELADVLQTLEELARRDPRGLPRYSDLRYIPKHFKDVVQADLPCAESQLKLMIHSRGEIGGCWGHAAGMSIRDKRIRDVIASPEYRAEHERLFRKQCVGCGSNYSLNLRWRPGTYVDDALWRRGRRSLLDELAPARLHD